MRLRTALVTSVSSITLAMLPGMVFAQSTGTRQIEEITVSARRVAENLGGLIAAEQVAKSRSSITQDYIETQAAGQSIAQSLNLLPGVNFTNNDPYGSSGGNIRLRSFDGNRISLTFDGMPLNDTGNYAIFTNQLVDGEIIEKTSVNLGTTDVDSPTAAATGGTINVLTRSPRPDFGVVLVPSYGSYDYRRVYGSVDSGELGSMGTAAFATVSYQKYEKFKGPGELEKKQFNAKIIQPIGNDDDFVSVAGHFNVNRNNFYRNLSKADVAFYGYGFDNLSTCLLPSKAGGAGVQNDGATVRALATTPQFRSANDNPANPAACTNFYNLRVNPSNTGNIRVQSSFGLAEGLTLTVDPSYQYVLANGGGTTVVAETDGRLRGSSTAAGVDLNGDGDTVDSVRLYTPNTTNTNRYGATASLIYAINDTQAVRAAYTIDYGRHRQTGQFAHVLADGSPSNVFAGLKGTPIKSANNADLRGRDRFSIAALNQIAFNYDGAFVDGIVRVNAGVRAPFFRRELNNYCFTQNATSTAYCTTQVPTAPAADGTVGFTGSALRYVAPFTGERKYDKILPNLGLSARPFGDDHMFYFSFAQGLAAPRTDNLYSFQILNVQPETTNSFDVGYRFQTPKVMASAALWKTDFKNRIVSSFDPDLGINVDRNLGSVALYGLDVEAGVTPIEDLSFNLTASYNHSKVANDTRSGAITYLTAGKKLVETPDWTLGGRVSYKIGDLSLGAQAKYVGRRFSTDINDDFAPSYTTLDFTARYALDGLGLQGTYVQFNVINAFDKKYFGSISSQISTAAGTPLFAIAARSTVQMTLHAEF